MNKGEGTVVYGASDDLIEFEGDVYGEVGAYGTDDEDGKPVLLIFSDGTLLKVKYGKNDEALWGIELVKKGTLFDRIEVCEEENDAGYTDRAFFKPGLKGAYAARQWEKVK